MLDVEAGNPAHKQPLYGTGHGGPPPPPPPDHPCGARVTADPVTLVARIAEYADHRRSTGDSGHERRHSLLQ